MIRRPPRSTPKPSSAASDVYKRQEYAPLYAGMPAWHATGTADPLGGAALRRALEDDPAITTYFVEGGNHSLDTPEDYTIGLEALKDIVRKYEEAMR